MNTNAARYQNLSLNPLKLSGQCGRLKCCLNYELDGYMEALKDFPVEEHLVLEFADGEYKSVKTDILKRMMWFAPRAAAGGDWKGLTVEEVKEYKELNRQGVKPEVLTGKKEEKVKVVDFQNDMGTESLTRLDDQKKPQKKNKNRNNRSRNNRDKNKNSGTNNPPTRS